MKSIGNLIIEHHPLPLSVDQVEIMGREVEDQRFMKTSGSNDTMEPKVVWNGGLGQNKYKKF